MMMGSKSKDAIFLFPLAHLPHSSCECAQWKLALSFCCRIRKGARRRRFQLDRAVRFLLDDYILGIGVLIKLQEKYLIWKSGNCVTQNLFNCYIMFCFLIGAMPQSL
jgi:hypothetical protein